MWYKRITCSRIFVSSLNQIPRPSNPTGFSGTKVMVVNRSMLESYSYICHVSLCNEAKQDHSLIYGSDRTGKWSPIRPHVATLVGKRTSSGIVLNDPEDGQPKLFFVFPDLSVRILGQYHLLCHICDVFKYIHLIL